VAKREFILGKIDHFDEAVRAMVLKRAMSQEWRASGFS